MATEARQSLIVLPGEGKVYQVLGTVTTLLARSQDTGGDCEVIESAILPETALPPHFHRQSDELVYILEGSITLQIGGQMIEAPTGSFAFIPRGTIHALHNETAVPCRMLIWAMPRFGVGMEGFLEGLKQLPSGPPDIEMLLPFLQKYDMEIVQ